MQRWGRQQRGAVGGSGGRPGAADQAPRSFWHGTLRGLTLRCPRCGSRGLFRSWFRLRSECPTCGLALERGESEDHWFGAVAVNLVAAELLGLALIVIWIVAAWPRIPWTAIQYAGPFIMIALPLVFYPFSRALWLAWDYHFRPAAEGDKRGLPAP